MCQNGHKAVEKAYGREVGDGAEKQGMEREMCTEHDKEGRGWERQYKWQSKLQRCEHGQTCTKDRTGAVALRAALESAV
jgi:hypothetical protein